MRNRGTYKLTNDLGKDVYLIMATSKYCAEEQPCDDAYQIPLIGRDIRDTDDPAKTPYYNGETDWWYGRGTNHQLLDDGCIYRELEIRPTWVIKVPDIMAFIEKEGQCVISIDRGRPSIEIYDGWRE